jgi:hypothetical protein
MGRYVVKGRRNAITVYEILGYSGEAGEAGEAGAAVRKRSPAYLELYRKGLEAFESGDLEAAGSHLADCAKLHDLLPEDPASRLMLDMIRQQEAAESPSADWLGQIVLDSK